MLGSTWGEMLRRKNQIGDVGAGRGVVHGHHDAVAHVRSQVGQCHVARSAGLISRRLP